MSDEEWSKLPNEERIARNVAAYEGAAKAEHDRRGQAIAAMDGREYDYETGRVKGLDGPPLVVGNGDKTPVLSDAIKQNAALDAAAPRTKLHFGKHGWTDEPEKSGGTAAGPSMSDMIDLAKLQEQQDYHGQQLNMDRARFGLDATKADLENQRGLGNLQNDTQRTMSDVARTHQEMQAKRQEQLTSAFQNSGLSQPMIGVGQSIAAQYPQIPQDVLMAALADVSGAQTGDPGSGWNPFAGKKKWGELEKFDNPTAPATEVLKRAQEIMKQRKAGK